MSLGTGAKEGWWGCPCKYEAQQGGFHGNPVSETSPACGHQTAPSHWRNFSGNTYLTQYLPGTDFQHGREGQGSKFASEIL